MILTPIQYIKEQCLYVVEVFNKIADRRNVKLKLVKKQN